MILLLCLLVTEVIGHSDEGNWGYASSDGPSTWDGVCKTGKRQSPIDIVDSAVDCAELMSPLKFVNYQRAVDATLANNGRSVSVSGFGEGTLAPAPFLIGGNLKYTYIFNHVHIHWSQSDAEGSEHTFNGKKHPAELHFVHLKEGLSFEQALATPDGITVVAVFATIGYNQMPMKAVADAMGKVIHSGDTTILESFRPSLMLPMTTVSTFYAYDGSLTTPGCNEVVQWFLMPDPISITREQFVQLRKLQTLEGPEHEANFRPVQPLNGRRIQYRASMFVKPWKCDGNGFRSAFPSFLQNLLKF